MATKSKRYVEKRMLLTRVEARQANGLIDDLIGRSDCTISFSNLVRGMIRLAVRADDDILESLDFTQLKRPMNGDEQGLQQFEERIAELLFEAIKRSEEKRDGDEE